MALFKNMLKPAIICLHGRGTSGMIFEIQAMPLLRLLEDRFDFIFVDAPIESDPGPYVLPVFEDEGPYYSWLEHAPKNITASDSLDVMVRLLDELEVSHRHIVGILGFSQGAAVGLGLLIREQRRRDMAVPCVGYRFGIFVGGASVPPLMDSGYNNSGANKSQNGEGPSPWVANLYIPTIHATGNGDSFATQGKELRTWLGSQQNAVSFSFEGGHEMPRKREDVLHLANEMIRLYEQGFGY